MQYTMLSPPSPSHACFQPPKFTYRVFLKDPTATKVLDMDRT